MQYVQRLKKRYQVCKKHATCLRLLSVMCAPTKYKSLPAYMYLVYITTIVGIRTDISAPMAERPYFDFNRSSERTPKRMRCRHRTYSVIMYIKVVCSTWVGNTWFGRGHTGNMSNAKLPQYNDSAPSTQYTAVAIYDTKTYWYVTKSGRQCYTSSRVQ